MTSRSRAREEVEKSSIAKPSRESPISKKKRANSTEIKLDTLDYETVISTKHCKDLNHDEQNKCSELTEKFFLVKLPPEVFKFWAFCNQVSPASPKKAFDCMDLELVGIFDILNGDLDESTNIEPDAALCHWRYYFDVPEMQTFAVSLKNDYHLAYYRDTPSDESPLVVKNDGNKIIRGVADDIFSAFFTEMTNKIGAVSSNSSPIKTLLSKYEKYCEANKISYKQTTKLKKRQKVRQAPTLNTFGICVPIRNGNVGYRPISIDDERLEHIFKRLTVVYKTDDIRKRSTEYAQIFQTMQNINLADDESDFEMGLEFGLDLFASGSAFFHKMCQARLGLAYELLGRDSLGKILDAHLKNRRKGRQLSMIK